MGSVDEHVRRMFCLNEGVLMFSTDTQIYKVWVNTTGFPMRPVFAGRVYDFCCSPSGKMAAVVDKCNGEPGDLPLHLFELGGEYPHCLHNTTSLTDDRVVLRRLVHESGEKDVCEFLDIVSAQTVNDLPALEERVDNGWFTLLSGSGKHLVKYRPDGAVLHKCVGMTEFAELEHSMILQTDDQQVQFTRDGLLVGVHKGRGQYELFLYPELK